MANSSYRRSVCPKCNAWDLATAYNPVFDRLDRHCRKCGYKWSEEPYEKNKPLIQSWSPMSPRGRTIAVPGDGDDPS